MSFNFVWEKILQKILQLTVIVDKFSNFFKIFNRKTCFIVFDYVSKIYRKMFYKLKKLSHMKELIYNLVTWSDWFMALTWYVRLDLRKFVSFIIIYFMFLFLF